MSFAQGLDSALQAFMRMQMLQEQTANAKEDRAWQKMMRDREMEKWGMETAINNEMKAVPFELAAKKNNVGGQLLDENFVRKALPGMDPMAQQELAGALKGIKDPKQLAEAVKAYQPQFGGIQQPEVPGVKAPTAPVPQPQVPSLRAYKGDDGNMYMTADPEKYKPTQSEIMVEQARRLMSGKFGQQGMKQAAELMTQARETMKLENDMAFETAMNAPSFGEKVDGLLGILTGNAMVPGEAKITQSQDGKVQLIHTVPGREKPHVTVLKGDTPEDILADLALKVRARSNPDLLLRIQDRELEKMYRAQDREDRQAERDAERAHENRVFGLNERKFNHDVAMDNKRYGLQAADAADARRARAAAGKGMTPEQKIAADAQYVLRAGLAKTPEEATQLAYRRALGIKLGVGGGEGEEVPKDIESARKQFRSWLADEGASAPEAEISRRARIAGLNPAEFGARVPPQDMSAVVAAAKAIKGGGKPAPAPRSQAVAAPTRPRAPSNVVNVANDPVLKSLRATAAELSPRANTVEGAKQLQAIGQARNTRLQQLRAKIDPHIKMIEE